MKRNALFASLIVAVAMPAAAHAQHEASIALSITDPRGEFDRNTDTGFGLTGTYLYSPVPNRAVAFGFTGTFQTYGSTDRRAPLSGSIPDITVDVDTDNQTAFVQGLLQIKPFQGPIQPYVQGNAGWGFFFTRTSIDDPFTGQPLITDTNQSDGTWIWGGGGGLQVRVYEGPRRAGVAPDGGFREGAREPMRAYLDLGARYLKGNTVEYLREGSLVTDEGEFDIDRRLAESEIELMQYQIGVTLEF